MKNIFLIFLFILFSLAAHAAPYPVVCAADGSHALTFPSNAFQCASITGGGGSPGGSNYQLQYNNSSSFGGIALGTSGYPLISAGTSGAAAFGVLGVGGGGTGNTTLTAHGVLIGEGTSAIAQTAVGTSGYLLTSNGSSDPTYQQLNLGSSPAITGSLPIADLAAIGSNTVLANVTSSAAVPTAAAWPNCTDSGGNHLNYTLGTGISCGTTASVAGTVISVTFTGDGTVLSSTPSSAVTTSGTVTAALATAGADTVLGNATGSTATPTYTSAPVVNTISLGTSTTTNAINILGTSAQTINMVRGTSVGNNLTVRAGGGVAAGTNEIGGNLFLNSGISTGTGTSQIQFGVYKAGSSGTSDNSATTAMTIASTGDVGIGTATPNALLTLNANTSGALPSLSYSSPFNIVLSDATSAGEEIWGFGGAPLILGHRASGTNGSSTATAASATLIAMQGGGYNGSSYTVGAASISEIADSLFSGSNYATDITFSVTPTSSTTSAKVVELYQNGGLAVGTSGWLTTPPANGLIVEGSAGINDTSPTYDLSFGGTAAREIWVERGSSTGNNLTVQAGGGVAAGTNENGGNLTLASGISTGSGSSSMSFNIYKAGSSGTTDNTATTAMTLTNTGALNIGSASQGLQLNGSNAISYPASDSTLGASIAIGPGALSGIGTTSAAYQDIAIGYNALSASIGTTAVQNVAIGYNSLKSLTSGEQNVAIGASAENSVTSGQYNMGIGALSLNSETSGTRNVGVGYGTLYWQNGSNDNTAVGDESMAGSSVGSVGGNNTGVGQTALYVLQSGASNNVGIGAAAGGTITTGNNNTAIGRGVGDTTLTTGSYNILIGTNTGVDTPSSSTSDFLNIGNLIYGTGLGTSGTTPAGAVGILTTSPTYDLSFSGTANREIWVERGSTIGKNLTIQAGGGIAAGSNENGGNLILNSGVSTGTGSSNIQMSIYKAGSSGTTDNSATVEFEIDGSGHPYLVGAASGSLASYYACFDPSSSPVGEITYQATNCTTSLRSTKHAIEPYKTAMSDIMALKPSTFIMNTGTDGRREIGLIAEEALAVNPLLVGFQDGKLRTVQYDRLGVVAISGIQEQEYRLNEMQKEIEALKKEVRQLKKEVK